MQEFLLSACPQYTPHSSSAMGRYVAYVVCSTSDGCFNILSRMRLIKYLGFITFQINVCMFTINLTVTEANDTAFLNTSLRILIYAQ